MGCLQVDLGWRGCGGGAIGRQGWKERRGRPHASCPMRVARRASTARPLSSAVCGRSWVSWLDARRLGCPPAATMLANSLRTASKRLVRQLRGWRGALPAPWARVGAHTPLSGRQQGALAPPGARVLPHCPAADRSLPLQAAPRAQQPPACLARAPRRSRRSPPPCLKPHSAPCAPQAPASARVLTQTEQITRGFATPAQPAAEGACRRAACPCPLLAACLVLTLDRTVPWRPACFPSPASCSRHSGRPTAAEDEVLAAFRESQQQYQQLMQGLQVRWHESPGRPWGGTPLSNGSGERLSCTAMQQVQLAQRQLDVAAATLSSLLWHVWQRALATRPAMLPLIHAPPTHTVPQSINLPLTGDDAAIKKYAAEVEALKKKIGMPDVEEVRRRDLQCWVAAGK